MRISDWSQTCALPICLLAPATLAQGDWRPLEARAAADGRREPGAGAGRLAGTARRSPAARRDGSAQGHGDARDRRAPLLPRPARWPASLRHLACASIGKLGRAHVCTPVTHEKHVCRLLIET